MTQTATISQWILESLFLISAPSFLSPYVPVMRHCRYRRVRGTFVVSSYRAHCSPPNCKIHEMTLLLKPCNKFQGTTYSNRSRLSARVDDEALVKRWLRNLWRFFSKRISDQFVFSNGFSRESAGWQLSPGTRHITITTHFCSFLGWTNNFLEYRHYFKKMFFGGRMFGGPNLRLFQTVSRNEL